MDKKATRKKYIEIRKNIDEKKRFEESALIVSEVRKIMNERNFDAILLYAPKEFEVDVFSLFKDCHKTPICFPRVSGSEMDFYFVDDEKKLKEGNFKVREPEENCEIFIPQKNEKYLVIVPGVCFDKEGYRIGYGKGYYDKYLSKYEGFEMYKVGVCFEECMIEKIEKEDSDIRMDKVLFQ